MTSWPADDKLLDEHARGVLRDHGGEHLAQLLWRTRDAVLGDSLGGALEVGFDDDGVAKLGQRLGERMLRVEVGPGRRGDASLSGEQLGHLFVERQTTDVGIRAGEGEPELLEERGVERLAVAAARPLCGVEDELGAQRLEPRDEARGGARDLDRVNIVTERAERLADRFDGRGGVELGVILILRHLQVVSEGDAHGHILVARLSRALVCGEVFAP